MDTSCLRSERHGLNLRVLTARSHELQQICHSFLYLARSCYDAMVPVSFLVFHIRKVTLCYASHEFPGISQGHLCGMDGFCEFNGISQGHLYGMLLVSFLVLRKVTLRYGFREFPGISQGHLFDMLSVNFLTLTHTLAELVQIN